MRRKRYKKRTIRLDRHRVVGILDRKEDVVEVKLDGHLMVRYEEPPSPPPEPDPVPVNKAPIAFDTDMTFFVEPGP